MILRYNMSKILAVGIIVLFTGVSVSSGFAVDTNPIASNENENPSTTSGEIYENTNCFVMGYSDVTWNRVNIDKGICFGHREGEIGHPFWTPSSGEIYTFGPSVKWNYTGKFYGQLGETPRYVHPDTETDNYHYYGIKGFRGLSLGAKLFIFGSPIGSCIFIGFAEHVKISSNKPPIN